MKEIKNSKIKTAIIEHRRELREDLIRLVNSTTGFFCSGNYGTLKNALANFKRETPDIVLWNQSASRTNDIRALRENFPGLPILILNIYEDETVFDRPNAEDANACLLKLSLPVQLLKSVRKFLSADAPASSEILARVIGSFGKSYTLKTIDNDLTPHETRLLKLLVEGHDYTTAAKMLKVSYNTVKFHMRRIFQKLEVNSKSAAVIKAMRYRLIN
jgi:DNA-binding NarL/FixJ family response regulator